MSERDRHDAGVLPRDFVPPTEYIKSPVTLLLALRDFAGLAVQEFLYTTDRAIMEAQRDIDDAPL